MQNGMGATMRQRIHIAPKRCNIRYIVVRQALKVQQMCNKCATNVQQRCNIRYTVVRQAFKLTEWQQGGLG
jgi:hypothetical protein